MKFKEGDEVMIKPGTMYFNGKHECNCMKPPLIVKKHNISGDLMVYGSDGCYCSAMPESSIMLKSWKGRYGNE